MRIGPRLAALALIALTWWWSGRQLEAQRPPADLHPTVILVSFDGWRWDYARRAQVPALRSVAARGLQAERLIPSFPSKTFPNHYTLVTGLYPGHHGILANNIYDAPTGRMFTLSNRREVQDPMWWGGEPLWVTLRRAGKLSAPLFWPGSEAPIGGAHARYWMPFDDDVPAQSRIDRLLAWLDLPVDRRPVFLTLYFSDVDTAGHEHGPDSPNLRRALERVDAYLNRLLRGLEARGLVDRVNLVIVSDHGMAETNPARMIVLDDHLPPGSARIIDLNPTLALLPAPGREEEVYRALVSAHPHLRVYRREDTPAHWRLHDHPRIPPIVGVADDGWLLVQRRDVRRIERRGTGGAHGYDPRAASMHGIFVAAGPAFRRGTVPPIENVHVYNALAAALGMTPAANDGDVAISRTLLTAAAARVLEPVRGVRVKRPPAGDRQAWR